jgi:hypothetical protein
MIKKLFSKSERGQAIILVAFAIIGMVAIIGLMTDGGMLLIEYARLKRGIDAASIAAAQQFRKGFTNADLENAGREFLQFNQSDADQIHIYTCDYLNTEHDATLCTTPIRKLVRVTATRTVNFGFMRVVGINSTTITATSVSEAASIDLVLVIDTSASMAYETSGDPNISDPGDDPSVCNLNNTCQPMADVKAIARQFVSSTMFFPYDRVAIVTLTSQTPGGNRAPSIPFRLTDPGDVDNALAGLTVFEPEDCPTASGSGPCLQYNTGSYFLDCPTFTDPTSANWGINPSSCTSSNVGGALLLAGSEFAVPPIRSDSFWVIISLIGGPANASTPSAADAVDVVYQNGYCPSSTWLSPFCRDALSATRHPSIGAGSNLYDAEDYARDQADFVANPKTGQGVTMFTIGLGNLIRGAPSGDADAAEKLLQYIALNAGDDTATPKTYTANHGTYSFAPDTSELGKIFLEISKNIITRISQ